MGAPYLASLGSRLRRAMVVIQAIAQVARLPTATPTPTPTTRGLDAAVYIGLGRSSPRHGKRALLTARLHNRDR